MAEGRWRRRLARAALTTFVATSLMGVARVTGVPLWWAVPLACVPALFVQRRVLPARLPRLFERLIVLTLVLLVIAGFVHTAYPIFPEDTLRGVIASLALALGLVAWPATFAQPALSAARVHLPAGTGLLLAAGLSVSGETRRLVMPELLALPLIAVVVFLLAEHAPLTSRGTAGLALRRSLRLTLSLGTAGLIAFGTTRLLPWAQPYVEQAFAAFFGDRAGQGSSGFGRESRLGDIESLALDQTLALRLWSDAPPRLRLRASTRFDGHSWKGSPAQTRRRSIPAASAVPAVAALAELADVPGATFVLAPPEIGGLSHWGRILPAITLGTEALALPLGTTLVRSPEVRLESDAWGVVAPTSVAEPGLFGYVAALAPPAEPLTPEQLAAALELPPSVDPRLRALAADLARESAGVEGRVAATLAHLQTHCHYALDVGRFATDDPVSEFVFDKRRGYCEYFATAAALLLRLEGVPARYVTGFSSRGASRVGDHYLVRLSDAHAWIEYYDGRAWHEADPTPPAEYDLLHARGEGWWVAAWESLRSVFGVFVASVRQALRTGAWAVLGRLLVRMLLARGVGLVVFAAFAAWALRRLPLRRWFLSWRPDTRRNLSASNANAPLRALWVDVEGQLARQGLVRPASCPPLEFIRSLPEDRVPPEQRQLAEEVALALYAGLYAGLPPPAEACRDLRQRVDIARGRHDNRGHWEVTR